MFVNDRVRVMELRRAGAPGDRSSYVGRDGDVTQRLNVPWEPRLGALWRVRFEDGSEQVFAEAEMGVLDESGRVLGTEIEDLEEHWGVAPRSGSVPFRRRLSSGMGQAVLAFIVLSIAGLLLIGAGVAAGDLRISAAGGALLLVGLGTAAAMLT